MSRMPSSKHDHLKFAAIFFLLFIAGAGTIVAQTGSASPTPPPKSEEVLRLEEEKAQAVLRKDIAEANKAELEAKFPKPTSSPLAGTTTVNDGAIIESQIVAYSALARAANKLVGAINANPRVREQVSKDKEAQASKDKKINPNSVVRLAIFNEDDVRLLLSYRTTRSQIEVLRQSYCLLLVPAVTGQDCKDDNAVESSSLTGAGAGVSIAKSLLGSFVDLTSFLRTNVEIKGQSFDIDEAPLVAEVFRAARNARGPIFKDALLYYPKFFPPETDIKADQADSEADKQYIILGRLDRVFRLRNIAGGLIAGLEKNKEDLTKAKTKFENLTITFEQQSAALAAAKERLSILLKAHCPGVPECDRDDPTALDARLRRFCPKLTGEQRERILEQASLIKQLQTALDETKLSLKKAEKAAKELEDERARLFEAFSSGAFSLNVDASLPDDKKKAANELAIADVVAQLKARNDQVDKLIAGLVQAGTGSGVNALTSLIKAENILSALKPTEQGASYWLQLKVVKAGGNNRIKTNLLWDIFTGGNRVSHSGGVIVEYILFDNGGTAVASDTIAEYTNYIKADKVKKLPAPDVDDMGPLPSKKEKKKSETVTADGN